MQVNIYRSTRTNKLFSLHLICDYLLISNCLSYCFRHFPKCHSIVFAVNCKQIWLPIAFRISRIFKNCPSKFLSKFVQLMTVKRSSMRSHTWQTKAFFCDYSFQESHRFDCGFGLCSVFVEPSFISRIRRDAKTCVIFREISNSWERWYAYGFHNLW